MQTKEDKPKFTWSHFRNENAPLGADDVAYLIDGVKKYDSRAGTLNDSLEIVQELLLEKHDIYVGKSTLRRIAKEFGSASGRNYDADSIVDDLKHGLSRSLVAQNHGVSKSTVYKVIKDKAPELVQGNPFEQYMSSQSSILEQVVEEPVQSPASNWGWGRTAATAAGLVVAGGLLTVVPGCDNNEEETDMEIISQTKQEVQQTKELVTEVKDFYKQEAESVKKTEEKFNTRAGEIEGQITKTNEEIGKTNEEVAVLRGGLAKHDKALERQDKEIVSLKELRNEIALPTSGTEYSLLKD